MNKAGKFWLQLALAAALVSLGGCAGHQGPAALIAPPAVTAQPVPAPLLSTAGIAMTPVSFPALQGWSRSDPRRALDALRWSCIAIMRKGPGAPLGGSGYAGTTDDWRDACQHAFTAGIVTIVQAREFFEKEFVPERLSAPGQEGFFTGYFEPDLRGSRTRHDQYQTPVYGLPSDLVTIDGAVYRDTATGDGFAGRMMMSMMMMRYVPYPARAEIERNGVPAKPLFFVDDPVDAFFLQIQGSGRVTLDDGTVVRASYAGQNGQPYTAIGSVLLQRGELTSEEISLQTIRAWLHSHPDQARQVMDADESYVFFTEQPIGEPLSGANGAEGVPLTPGASLAVDLAFHALGVPFWLEGTAPDPDPNKPDRVFDRLLIAQDTGGAIKGPLRGDVYWGFGPDAAAVAGRMKNSAQVTVMLPKALAARMGDRGKIPVS